MDLKVKYVHQKLHESLNPSVGDLMEVFAMKEGEMRIRRIPKVEELITRAARKRKPIRVEDLEKELEHLQVEQMNASLADMKRNLSHSESS